MGRISIALMVCLLVVGCSEKRPAPPSNGQVQPTSSAARADKPAASKDKKMEPKRIPGSFEPQVAGQFYDASPAALRTQVQKFIDTAAFKDAASVTDRDILGIIAPHAGYMYSGPIAGEAYRAVKGRPYKTVVVMALCHRHAAAKLAVLNRPGYDTPLGSLEIDRAGVAKLLADYPAVFDSEERVFRGEHSLEVQLPFIQVALPGVKIIPIIAAVYDNEDIIGKAAEALYTLFGKRKDVLFVASTDLTHFMPYDEAVKYDTKLMSLLDNWRIDEWKAVAPTKKGMCGFLPVLTLIDIFSKFDTARRKVTVLDYRNSGDTTGDKSRGVVGYGAVAFSLDTGVRKETDAPFGHLTATDRRYLMNEAKAAVLAAVRGEPFSPPAPPTAITRAPGAAFVTLKKHGELRGCIGHVIARVPLFECVASVAKAAAIQDTRFSPVTEAELKSLAYEISVLTAPTPTTPDEVVVGRDGLIMSRGGYSGLLLPQVPVEWHWDRETFLAHTCRKAGLPTDCWKDPETRIERFEAIVFGEGDLDD